MMTAKTATRETGRGGVRVNGAKGAHRTHETINAKAAGGVSKNGTISTPEAIRHERRMRFNPLRSLTAESLTMALDSFIAGDLRQASLLWEMIAERDDTIPGVKYKREASTAHRDWQVLKKDDSRDAKRHAEVLEAFWHDVTAVNAYDRNERGGIRKLIMQMMSAVSYKYAVHHIVWKPQGSELSAEFEFVPLHFFENREGKLRFIKDGISAIGEEMPDGEWMVHVGQGLMVAASIGYYGKRLALHDLLAFSEKFGTPGVLGKTSAAQDSEAGRAVRNAVAAFSSDWSGVMYGDDSSGKIELIQANASATALPFPHIIERADRKIAALYRGADLSTMSAGSGEGQGASLQGEEADILDLDDAATVSETLNSIERYVLEWHFGRGVKPKAYIKLIVQAKEDLTLLLTAIEKFVALGAPIEIADVMERFGFAKAKAGAELLKTVEERKAILDAAAAGAPVEGVGVSVNAAGDVVQRQEEMDYLMEATRLLQEAGNEDRKALTQDIRRIMAIQDAATMKAELKTWLENLPTAISQDAAQQKAWEKVMIGAFLNGAAAA